MFDVIFISSFFLDWIVVDTNSVNMEVTATKSSSLQVEVVTPNDSLIGGFSSDEEEPVLLDTSHINRETDLKNLTNDEIFYKLKELGETVGPILDSTRSIYEKRLSRVLNDDDAKDISAFSADEGEDEKEKETDTTDEYESHNEHIRGTGYNEQIL